MDIMILLIMMERELLSHQEVSMLDIFRILMKNFGQADCVIHIK